jgi:hypothetical protein
MIKSKMMRCYEKLFMGKLEGKIPPGRPKRGWVDYINMDLG